jgi:hypothetical protein
MEGVIRDRGARFGVSYEEMKKHASSASRCTAWSAPRTSLRWGAFLLSDAGANISGQCIGADDNVETLRGGERRVSLATHANRLCP